MKKITKRRAGCLLLGMAAGILSFFVDKQAEPLQEGFRLERGSYGQGEGEQELWVEGLGGEPFLLDVRLGEREYLEEEALAVMEEAAKALPALILGENPSLFEVRSQLNLMSWLEEAAIHVEWEREHPDLIGRDGTIDGTGCPADGRKTSLTARLSAGEFTREYTYSLIVFPPERTEEEALQERFLAALCEMEEEQRTTAYFFLPKEYEGKQLSYHGKRDSSALLFPALGLGTAVLLPALEREKEKERRKKEECQMMLEYPEILSKLAVYSGAGLPVRAAWERIVLEYEAGKKQKNPMLVYEEMAAAYYQMQRGIPERRAYVEFGERCHLLPYRKLAGILEQNVRKGSQQLRPILEAEMESAFEEKKALTRRLGEEASTKLLLPLFLMLSIVMVMVSMPAFLSFSF